MRDYKPTLLHDQHRPMQTIVKHSLFGDLFLLFFITENTVFGDLIKLTIFFHPEIREGVVSQQLFYLLSLYSIIHDFILLIHEFNVV